MPDNPALIWFRRDLRIADNPALHAAAQTGRPVLCVFIDHDYAGSLRGGASKWWLHHSLESLSEDLKNIGASLHIFRGEPETLIPKLVKEHGVSHVFWNRRYAKDSRDMDAAIKDELKSEGVDVESFNGMLLREPWEVKTGSDGWYKVFTPFWKANLALGDPEPPLPAPTSLTEYDGDLGGVNIDALDLRPSHPNWAIGLAEEWSPGSAGALARLHYFLDGPVDDYKVQRNIPGDPDSTSKLSAHLAFGEISPRQIWHITKDNTEKGAKFLSEVGWREFSYVLLFYNPDLATKNYKSDFDNFDWREDPKALKAWQKGRTGYPFVDAGMRELWATGIMHNRVRMVVASFLIKHLRIHWREGERWFWDTLVDADPANNAASWQWVAGSGADAAPYFRIFNPFTQGEKFDGDGDYVRRWVPELKHLPNKFLHRPWEAPALVLKEAGVELGKDYPKPIVEHKPAREAALAAYKASRED